jgi:hypothetical protein
MSDLVYKDRKVRMEEGTLKDPLNTSKTEIHQEFKPDGFKPTKHP